MTEKINFDNSKLSFMFRGLCAWIWTLEGGPVSVLKDLEENLKNNNKGLHINCRCCD